MKYNNKILIPCVMLLMLLNTHVHSWSDGGDEADPTIETPGIVLCSDTVEAVEKDTACNAWGLTWNLRVEVSGGSIGGEPENVIKTFESFTGALNCINLKNGDCESKPTDGWRLPNIKELAKMFRYTPAKDDKGQYIAEIGNTALAYPVMRKWFNGTYFNGTGDVTKVLSSAYDIEPGIEPYVLSSTYRDLDMLDDNGDMQVLLMNLMTGAIVPFTQGDFSKCPVGRANGTCNSGTIARDKDINPIFVFRVKTYTP